MALNAMFRSRQKRLRMVYQSGLAECGLACAAMIGNYHGADVSISELRKYYPVSLRGLNLANIIDICQDMGLSPRAISIDLDVMDDLALPAILHWNMDHFVILDAIIGWKSSKKYRIYDPASGVRVLSKKQFSDHFTGVALEIYASNVVQKSPKTPKLKLKELFGDTQMIKSSSFSILLIAALVQMFMLLSPLYFRIAIDYIYQSGDSSFLWAFGLGFLLLSFFTSISIWARDRMISDLSNHLNFSLLLKTARKLFSLPLSWFEQRFAADILSRFNSTQPISDLIGRGIIVYVLDGTVVLFCLIVLFFINIYLFYISSAFVTIFLLVAYFQIGALNLLNAELIAAQARDSANLIETLGGISAIKASAKEKDRLRHWIEKRTVTVNRLIEYSRGKVKNSFYLQTIVEVFGISMITTLVYSAMKGQMTIGVVFSGYFYYSFLARSLQNFTSAITELKSLDVHVERLADIHLGDSEEGFDEPMRGIVFDGRIELKDVSFSYGLGEPDIISSVSLVVDSGESVAIAGPSGCGKTTLMKIMLGLLIPTKGLVLIDGLPLNGSKLRAWRSAVGYVAQDDELYSGQIADNIAFFDSAVSMTRVMEVAKVSKIHDDIQAMPMRYNSMVGDMGSALSGGQKARVLLARALYNNPCALFIDEGTAHLDEATEAKVNATIGSLGMTRVFIAHRGSTLSSADRVIKLDCQIEIP